jgi:hypothetical protein
MKNLIATGIFLCTALLTSAQIDSSLFKRQAVDTTKMSLSMDAVYNRPFLGIGKSPVSLGGYAEVNWQYMGTDGVTDGHQFQMRRLTLFVASTIGKRIKFLTEIELEEGGKEIAIEFAAIDVEMHPLLNLRGGIVMNPIGAFNQNHDGPKWEFTDRPISATQMLPATWSNAGFGLFGKTFSDQWMFGYELYLTGGFDNTIIDNEENKTFLPAAKANSERFEESASGTPLFTGKVEVRHSKIGELGMSYMAGAYNTFLDDGVEVDSKRRLDVVAVDFNTSLPKINTTLTGEFAWVMVDIPSTYTQQYGNRQQGGFVDIVQPVMKRRIFGWDGAVVNVACRLEYVDWNKGTFTETGGNIAEDIWSIMPGISFRPTGQTVMRLNYRYQEQRDLLGNDPALTGGFSFGISSYF